MAGVVAVTKAMVAALRLQLNWSARRNRMGFGGVRQNVQT
jgi:hypothetical protein